MDKFLPWNIIGWKIQAKAPNVNIHVEIIFEELTFEDKSILPQAQEIIEEQVLIVYHEEIEDDKKLLQNLKILLWKVKIPQRRKLSNFKMRMSLNQWCH